MPTFIIHTTSIVADCPTLFPYCAVLFSIAVHFEFSLPFGKKDLKVSESNDLSVEVCVKLASTGSFESLRSAVTVILTFQDRSAKSESHSVALSTF